MSYRGTICRSLEWLFQLILLQFLKNRHFPYKKLPFLGALPNLKLLGPDKFSCPQLLRVLNTPYGVPKTLYCHGQLLQSPGTLVTARKLVQTLLTDYEVKHICPFLWTNFYFIFESSQTRAHFEFSILEMFCCWLWNFRSSCCHFAVWAMLASVTIGSDSFQFWLMIKCIFFSNYLQYWSISRRLEAGVFAAFQTSKSWWQTPHF